MASPVPKTQLTHSGSSRENPIDLANNSSGKMGHRRVKQKHAPYTPDRKERSSHRSQREQSTSKKPELMCTICRDNLLSDRTIKNIALECMHTFHPHCIIPWFRTRRNSGDHVKCPECQTIQSSTMTQYILNLLTPDMQEEIEANYPPPESAEQPSNLMSGLLLSGFVIALGVGGEILYKGWKR